MLKNIFYSVFRNKCPQCHHSNVFETNNAYDIKRFDKMNDTCACCGLKYSKEPGYFQGAMYVSYGLMSGWFMLTWAIDYFLLNLQTWQYLLFFSLSILVLMPLTFRISRLLWINLFVRYDETKVSINQKQF